jgi:hypothetical protein
MIGLVADLISFNRQLLEMTLERVRRLELDHFGSDATLGSDSVHGKTQQAQDPAAP